MSWMLILEGWMAEDNGKNMKIHAFLRMSAADMLADSIGILCAIYIGGKL